MAIQQTASQRSDHSRFGIAMEIVAFVALALASKHLLSLVLWRYAGPVSLVLTLAALTMYLHARGERWRSFGLIPLPGWKAKLMVLPKAALTLVPFAAVVGLATIVLPAMGFDFMTVVAPDVENRWGAVAGNIPHFLLWLGIVWTAAAFGEEMFFRGYLITRLGELFDGAKLAPVLAVIIPALIFGYGHFYYQGLRGAIVTAGIGLAFGTMFLVFRRNLWPLILLHGVIDTLTFTAIFLELE